MRTEKTSVLLNEAADFLENLELPKNALFSMDNYGVHPPGPKPQLDNLCGTTACAAGWLSLSPVWRDRGFESEWIEDPIGYWMLRPHGTKWWESMGKEVFGTTPSEIHNIFMMVGRTREEVAVAFQDLALEYEERGE